MSLALLPNFVIAGAPKCGTSTLFKWLADHPQAHGSSPKELFYLMDRDNPFATGKSAYHTGGLEGYRRLFEGCVASPGDVVFEATTHYIYQQTALDVLANMRPAPRVLFLLRRPSRRLYSSFQYTKNNLGLVHRKLDFADYVELLQNPSDSLRHVVMNERSAFVLRRDFEYGRYANYLEPWLRRYPRERVQVRLFEDLASAPRDFMRSVCEFLAIEPGFYDSYDFPRRNSTVTIRSQSLQRVGNCVNRLLPRNNARLLLKRLFQAVQSREPAGMSARDSAALSAVGREYEQDNRRLAALAGLDLSNWNEKP